MRLTAAIAIASTALGCSLFTSFGGLSNDADDPGGDASADGGGAESGGDDGDASDGSPDGGGFCATKADASICDDFDGPNGVSFAGWIVNTENGGIVSIGGGGFTPPNALSVRADFREGDQVSACLERSFGVAKRARVAYRFRFEELEDVGFAQIGQLVLTTNGGAVSSIRMTAGGGVLHFEGAIYPTGTGGPGTFPNVTPQFPTDKMWHSVDMSVDWEASPARVTIDYDGQRAAENAPLTGSTFGPGSLRLTTGFYYREGGRNVPWRMLVDDFVAWVE